MAHYKRLIMSVLLFVALISGMLIACSSTTGTTTTNPNPGGNSNLKSTSFTTVSLGTGTITGSAGFEMVRAAADTYLSTGKATNTITAKALYTVLTSGKTATEPFVISTRTPVLYHTGHICTAILIPLRSLFLTTSWATLPSKDTNIVMYSETGNEAGNAVSLLNMLGYNITPLLWGFTSWYKCPVTAPGLFRPASGGGVGMNYPMDTTATLSTKTFDFPTFKFRGNNLEDLIKVAGNAWFDAEVPPPADYQGTDAYFKNLVITPQQLFNWIGNPSNIPLTWWDNSLTPAPFIVDVRTADYYAKGHIAGAINIPITDIAKPENLHKLPTNQEIIVVDNDGQAQGQVVSILNVLGYNATGLEWGMMGWTTSDVVVTNRFREYVPGSSTVEQDIMEYPFCTMLNQGSYNTDGTPVVPQ